MLFYQHSCALTIAFYVISPDNACGPQSAGSEARRPSRRRGPAQDTCKTSCQAQIMPTSSAAERPRTAKRCSPRQGRSTSGQQHSFNTYSVSYK